MTTRIIAAVAALAAISPFAAFSSDDVSEVSRADRRVEYRDCPKCDKRIRIDLAADKAYVNLSRLEGADKEVVAARAARLLDAARIPPASDPKIRPLMGWSSWNTFGVGISEDVILETARAMATNGLKAAGYTYVNIDDGFFWGHGEDGILRFNPKRFPNGMKPVVDGIHALGLKAGIYSDAGADTCGSVWGGGPDGPDKGGVGGGLYGHDAADCKLHFVDLGFDFIKVDYCGGFVLRLDERTRYTEIANAIKATGRTDVRLNICRWGFPGTWAADIAESWRTTGDIRANWGSIRQIIGENLYLSAYSKPGHYNDMDMLEVGQLVGQLKSVFGKNGDTGITPDEETTHFGMWCMLSSPLLIGCDVRTIPASTKALITNPYLLGSRSSASRATWRSTTALTRRTILRSRRRTSTSAAGSTRSTSLRWRTSAALRTTCQSASPRMPRSSTASTPKGASRGRSTRRSARILPTTRSLTSASRRSSAPPPRRRWRARRAAWSSSSSATAPPTTLSGATSRSTMTGSMFSSSTTRLPTTGRSISPSTAEWCAASR